MSKDLGLRMSEKIKHYLMYVEQNYSFAILRPLQEAILKRGENIAWFIAGKEANKSLLKNNERSLTSIDEIMTFNPDAIFYPANMAPTFLPGLNVAIFHGFDAGKLDKRGNNDHFKIRNCFDLYCTQGPSTTQPFKELEKQHSHFKVIETGWCALDELFKESPTTNTEKPTILMCSTFSKRLSCAPHLLETVKKLSETGKWNWLVQFHPKMPLEIINSYKNIQNDNLSFIEASNVIPLLRKADVMVCDTSSVLLMFLLLNKPVVSYKNIAPRDYLLNITEPNELEEAIEYALSKPKELMHNISNFISQTHPIQDGNASERVLDTVDDALSGKFALTKKPYDIVRQFKMRNKLKYWKFCFRPNINRDKS
ncbi:MAG: hypothetical protein ACI8O8_001497 [Oleiphilaceae bacterium]|jgi:hypothetical protein